MINKDITRLQGTNLNNYGLFINYFIQLGRGVWRKLTNDDDVTGGGRENTLTALQDTLTMAI